MASGQAVLIIPKDHSSSEAIVLGSYGEFMGARSVGVLRCTVLRGMFHRNDVDHQLRGSMPQDEKTQIKKEEEPRKDERIKEKQLGRSSRVIE